MAKAKETPREISYRRNDVRYRKKERKRRECRIEGIERRDGEGRRRTEKERKR